MLETKIRNLKSPVKKHRNVDDERQKEYGEGNSDDEEKYEMESEIDEPVRESGSQYETETDASQTTGTEDSVDLDRLVKLVTTLALLHHDFYCAYAI